jgi:hypothetical protein
MWLVLLSALTLAGSTTAGPADLIPRLLESEAGLTASLWSALDAGRVVAKVLDTPDRSEVMTVAVVRVRATRQRFLECARDVHCLRQNEDVVDVGRLSPLPESADLKGLSVDARDVDYLRRCRFASCDVRLWQEAIARFRREMAWGAPSHPERVEALFRQTLADYAAEYSKRGATALPAYDDNPFSVSIGGTLVDLLHRRFFTLDADPGFRAALASTAPPVGDADDFLYWYQERFWRKTLTALCHVTIRSAGDGASDIGFVLSRQIYASHYFDGAVELTLFQAAAGSDRGLLVFLSRARIDIRPSGFTWLERVLINRLVRRRLEGQFRSMRDRLEAAAGARGTRAPAARGNPSGTPRP